MCGRYAIFTAPHKLKDLIGTENCLNLPPRYNAAPLQDLPIIIHNRMGNARWGFLPGWAKADDRSMAAKMINARSETVSEKPAYRESWHKKRRCLVPADGFYEWRTDPETGKKQPYYIYRKDGELLLMAGLWSKWNDLVTFTVLTKDAAPPIKSLHHRMPVILSANQTRDWFSGSEQECKTIIGAAGANSLKYHPVGNAVGTVANDCSELIIPVIEQEKKQA